MDSTNTYLGYLGEAKADRMESAASSKERLKTVFPILLSATPGLLIRETKLVTVNVAQRWLSK
jgi:hypothetical protein